MAASILHHVRRRLTASAPLLAAAFLSLSVERVSAASLQEQIAQCATCHGENGQSQNPDIPSIGGQPKLFVMYQLFFYREGRRKHPDMNRIAKAMSDADLQAISDYVAGLPAPPPATRAIDDPARYRRGAALAEQRFCQPCHNADYSGREQMPRVAGQHEPYLLKALKDYRAGARIGTQAAMAEAVRGLDDASLADLAYFLARFRP